MSVKIRPIKPNEWEKLLDLNNQIFIDNNKFDEDFITDFANTAQGKSFFKEAVSNPDGICLVAEENGHWLGYTNGSHKPIPYRHSKYFEIENLGVIPTAQGKGIGKKLLHEITQWAKQNGYQKIYIESYAKNSQALGFYRSQGYQDIDISLEKKI